MAVVGRDSGGRYWKEVAAVVGPDARTSVRLVSEGRDGREMLVVSPLMGVMGVVEVEEVEEVEVLGGFEEGGN